ncbi:unnamed protein product, partial [Oppiella nova]
IALQRTGDPSGLNAIKQPLERLALIDPSPTQVTHPTLEELSEALECAKTITFQLIEFLQRFSPSYNNSSNNNMNRNKMVTNMCPNNNPRQRVSRVRPLMEEHPVSPQFTSEPFPPINLLSASSARHPALQQVVRPCASVQPSRIIRATNLTVSPTLAMGAHQLLAPTAPELGGGDSSQPHLTAMPTMQVPVLVTSTSSHTLIQNSQQMGASLLSTNLPSEDDQIIPFSDRPFVSKYGPVRSKYGFNLINTPTMSAPGNAMSQQLENTGARTQPTNVILGRSAVPSLTLIQPLQILTAAFLTDPNSNSQYGTTAFITEPTFPNTYMSGLMDLESNESHMNGLNG